MSNNFDANKEIEESQICKIFLLMSTYPTSSSARQAATALLEGQLAACISVSDIQSFYKWNGTLCEDQEQRLIAKCPEHCLDAARELILQLHPYELPQLLSIPIQNDYSYQPYLQWIQTECLSSRNRRH